MRSPNGQNPDQSEGKYSFYSGRWVACLGGEIIGQGGTPDQAHQAAKSSRFKEEPAVFFVPTPRPLTFHPIVARVREILPGDAVVYLVGGAVRDAFLNQTSHDLDFAVLGYAIDLARRVANTLGGAFYPLDRERDYGRVILKDGEQNRLVLDFTPIKDGDLEADLRSRDFSINAMAVDITEPEKLLDPLGGLGDLIDRRLRACSRLAFEEDPLRVLRAVRMAARFELQIDANTRASLKTAVPGLESVSKERIRDEIFQIVNGPRPAAAIKVLDKCGSIPYVLPELATLKGVQQTSPHIYDVWEHSLSVLDKLQSVFYALTPTYDPDRAASLHLGLISMKLGRYRSNVTNHLGKSIAQERTLYSLLSFASLYHDIGKPQTLGVDEGGRAHFFNHEQVGPEIIRRRALFLQLSNAECIYLDTIVRHHLRPLLLAQSGKPLSRRAIYRYFRDCGPAGVDICLLSLADMLGTYGPNLPTEDWSNLLEVVRTLLEAWWDRPGESIFPPAVINGNELIKELGIEPGKIVGEILEAIREAQATGKVHNRTEALRLARDKLREIEGS